MSSNAAVSRVEREFRRLDLTFKEEHQAELEEIRESDPGPHDQEEMATILVDLFDSTVKKYNKHCFEIRGDWRQHAPLLQHELDQLWRRHEQEINELESWAPYLAFYDAILTGDTKERLVDSSPKYRRAQAMMKMGHQTVDDLNLPYRIQQARQHNSEHVDLVDAFRAARLEAAKESFKTVDEVAQAGMAAQTEEQVDQLWIHWTEGVKHQKEKKATLKSTVGGQLIHDLFKRHADYELIKTLERATLATLRNIRRMWFYDGFDDDNTTDGEEDDVSEQEQNEEDDTFESDWESDDGVNVQWTAQDFQNLRNQLPPPIQITVDMAHLSKLEDRTVFQSQLFDDKCSNCLYEYTEPTELTGCHHIYCFKCIAPTAQGYKKCPECRAPVEMTELKIYEITRVGEAKDEKGQEAEDETMEDLVEEGKHHDDGSSKDGFMSEVESEKFDGNTSEEGMETDTEVEMEDAD